MNLQNDTDLVAHCQVMVRYFLLIDRRSTGWNYNYGPFRNDRASQRSLEKRDC